MLRIVDRAVEGLIALLVAAIVLAVFCGVVFRYLLNDPLAWVEEIARFSLVWVTFLGAYLALRRSEHIRVDNVFERLPKAGQTICTLVGGSLVVGFLAAMVLEGSRYALFFLNSPSDILEIPKGFVYAALPVSALMMIIAILAGGRVWLKRRGTSNLANQGE